VPEFISTASRHRTAAKSIYPHARGCMSKIAHSGPTAHGVLLSQYEMDKKAGTLVVDRFLYTPMRYPGYYGFIPHTLSADGWREHAIAFVRTCHFTLEATRAFRGVDIQRIHHLAGLP
jgi:hypothetical protein